MLGGNTGVNEGAECASERDGLDIGDGVNGEKDGDDDVFWRELVEGELPVCGPESRGKSGLVFRSAGLLFVLPTLTNVSILTVFVSITFSSKLMPCEH